MIKQPFVIIKNYRSQTKEKNDKKNSTNISQQQTTIKKKPKVTLEAEKDRNRSVKRDIQNEEEIEQQKAKMEEELSESYDKVNLDEVIPMQFSNNLRKQSLLDESPPHSREYSPAMKGLKGYDEDE